jgi:hypothetical protein
MAANAGLVTHSTMLMIAQINTVQKTKLITKIIIQATINARTPFSFLFGIISPPKEPK